MNIELLQDEIKAANKLISEQKAFVNKTKQEIADYLCPFKAGDKVINSRGEPEIIGSITYTEYGAGYSFKIFKIKKDGSPYKYTSYAYDESYYTKNIEVK